MFHDSVRGMAKNTYQEAYLKALAKRDVLIRRMVAAGSSKAEAGRKHGVSRERVRQIVSGK